jgi:hypothetical protein
MSFDLDQGCIHFTASERSQDVREPRPTKNIGLASEAALHGTALTTAPSIVAEFRAHLRLSRNRLPGKWERPDLC